MGSIPFLGAYCSVEHCSWYKAQKNVHHLQGQNRVSTGMVVLMIGIVMGVDIGRCGSYHIQKLHPNPRKVFKAMPSIQAGRVLTNLIGYHAVAEEAYNYFV